jgi:hypothetical protein
VVDDSVHHSIIGDEGHDLCLLPVPFFFSGGNSG